MFYLKKENITVLHLSYLQKHSLLGCETPNFSRYTVAKNNQVV